MRKRKHSTFDYRGFGHRLRVARIALGLSETEAAAVAKRSVDTWRKYEATGKGRCTMPILHFAGEYGLSLDWLLCGDAGTISANFAKRAQGKIAILPVKGARWQRMQKLARMRGLPDPA